MKPILYLSLIIEHAFEEQRIDTCFCHFIYNYAGRTVVSGLKEYNKDMNDIGGQPLSIVAYLTFGHFLSSTFENWENESNS